MEIPPYFFFSGGIALADFFTDVQGAVSEVVAFHDFDDFQGRSTGEGIAAKGTTADFGKKHVDKAIEIIKEAVEELS